jgi:hypothetical protein
VVHRLESYLPGIPLRPKPKSLTRGRKPPSPRLEARAGRQDCRVDGKGRVHAARKSQIISDLAYCGKTGSKGPVPACSYHVYGSYETLLLFFCSLCSANSIGSRTQTSSKARDLHTV